MSANLPAHPHLRHPLTGAPLRALGVTRSGRLIWPVLGGSQPAGEPAPAGSPVDSGATTSTTPGAPAAEPMFSPAQMAQLRAQFTNQPAPATPPAGGQQQDVPADKPFNPGVPWRELPVEDQVTYWQSQAKKHEGRQLAALGLKPGELEELRAAAAERDRLAEAGRTEAERAVSEAEQRGYAKALGEVGGKLVAAHMRAEIGTRMTREQVTGLLENLDLSRFQGENGDVDAARVESFVSALLPAAAPADTSSTSAPAATAGAAGQPGTGAPTRQVPDMGQGDRQIARPSGLAAGREIAAQRFGAQARSAARQQ
ncbi:hypothetical protein [Micromonospora chalcea]|uniref:hypothetical protein n=1 Tax=Micromonospora chalcea TaxID=1874 RepID=UPI003D75C757